VNATIFDHAIEHSCDDDDDIAKGSTTRCRNSSIPPNEPHAEVSVALSISSDRYRADVAELVCRNQWTCGRLTS
jgi:hypothetical protein